MSSSLKRSSLSTISRRQAASIAGLALLFMAILAPIANFAVLEKLIMPGHMALTLESIRASIGQFRLAGCLLLMVVILDLIVAWALYLLLKPVNPGLSLLTAWFRVVYAGIFALALSNLFVVSQLLNNVPMMTALGPGQFPAQVMLLLTAFRNTWDVGLILFGVHLLLLGYLVFWSGFIPTIFGLLVIVSGLGYLVDGFGKLLSADYALTVSAFTFIGEVLLIFWLLWKGLKGFDDVAVTRAEH